MYRTFFVFIFLLSALSAGATKNTYYTGHIKMDEPVIDGSLNDLIWNKGAWATDFVQRQPQTGQPATQQTQFSIVYNNNYLYIAIRCFDSAPDSIVRRMSRRDGQDGDLVKIVFDSYHNLRSGFSFGVTAAGVKVDESITNSNEWDASWDPVWDVKTQIDALGWTVEARIPFSQLRFTPKEDLVWGLEIQRVLSRNSETSVWQFISPDAAGYVNFMGELHGISGIQPRKQRELTPYVAGGIKNYQRDAANPFAPGTDYLKNAGIDGKFGLTNNLTVDLTVNPDFGQVEADPSEVNLSSFETLYSEKRPFFVEGKDILSFRLLEGGGPLSFDNLFYTRRIGRAPGYAPTLSDNEYSKAPGTTSILGAAKLTGRTPKGWSLGFLESVTQREYALIDREGDRREVTTEPLTNYVVSRVEKDLNSSQTQLGALFTATNRKLDESYMAASMHREAYTGGIDFTHRWKNRTYYLNFNTAFSLIKASPEALLGTQTSAPHYFQRPDAPHFEVDSSRTRLFGHGGSIQMGREGNGHWQYTFWVTWRSPGLNLNDAGYLFCNDEIQQVAWIKYSEFQPTGIFRKYFVEASQWYSTTFAGEPRYYGGNVGSQVTFINYLTAGLGFTREGYALSTEMLRGGPKLTENPSWNLYSHLSTDDRKKIKITLWSHTFQRQSHSFSSQTEGVEFRYQMNPAFRFTLTPQFGTTQNPAQRIPLPDTLTNNHYLVGEMAQKTASLVLRASYNITPDFTIELYGMPFLSAGRYQKFKLVNLPGSRDFERRYTPFLPEEITYYEAEQTYRIGSSENAPATFYFDDPDFHIVDFNSNLVLREFKPGSTAYLVWSQKRFGSSGHQPFDFIDDTNALFQNTYPTDILLFKISYRFEV